MATKSGDQGLRDWFGKSKSSDGKPGWVQLGGKYSGKPCARQPGQTSTPKCGSSKMKRNLSAKEEERARRRKNRQDPNQPEKTGGAKPTNVKTEEMNIQEVKDKPGKGSGKKDACYNKVKSRYSVWPSAYASGALVKCRKVGAANWGNKTESVEFSNWRDDFKAMEYEFIDLIKPEPLVTEASFEIKHTSADVRKAEKQKKIDALAQKGSTEGERRAAARKAGTSLPSFKKEEVDKRRAPAELVARLSARREGEMAQDGPNKPAYDAKQRLLAKAKAKRMKEEVESIDELKCWKGYKRKKGVVPGAKGSCVKENEDVIDEARRAKKARNPKSYKEVKKEIDNKEFRAGKLTPAQKHEIEKKENLKSTSSFSRHRMTGSGGHGSEYRVNPRISYIRNQYEIENEIVENSNAVEVPSRDIKKLVKKAVKRIDYDVDGDVDPQDKVEKKTGEYGEQLPTPFGKFRTKVKNESFSDWRLELDEDWQKVNKSDKTDGMSAAAVKAYRRENPGSKLKTAVTGDPKPGSKDAKRRKSFCARSKGQQDMHNIDCSKTPDKPVCKARRRWKC